MTKMFNMGLDWSFDLFAEDADLYKATPIKGVYPRNDASEREQFMTWFKGCARDFKEEWLKNHKGLYDRYEGYIGDAFARLFSDMCFSDYYKDTYNQRPHLSDWYYVHLVGFPHSEDILRMFCSSPIEDAVGNAREYRSREI